MSRLRKQCPQKIPDEKYPEHYPPESRLLRAQNEFWCAGAVWEKKGGEWVCVKAAPIIAWMRGMDAARAKLELARRGCSWEWT